MLSRDSFARLSRALERHRAAVVVAALALVVAGVSIPAHRFVMGGDSPWPELAPRVTLAQHASAWASYAGLGEDDAFTRPILPIAAADLVLESAGLSPMTVNHLWLVALLLLQALASVRLFLELFPSARRDVSTVFVGCAALLNPLVLLTFHTPYPALNLGIAAAPGMLAAFLAFVRRGRTPALLEFGAWTLLTLPSNMNPAFELEYVVALFGTGLFAFALRRKDVRAVLARIAGALLLYAGLNAPFWVPIFHDALTSYALLASSGSAYTAGTLASTSAFSQMQNVVRLVGGYLFFNPVGKELYVPAGPSYVRNAFVIAASLGLPFLAWACAFVVRRRVVRSMVWALTGIAFILLFLAKGVAPPFGGAFAWLFVHVPLFAAFREPYDKLGRLLLLCYVLLAGIALREISRRAPRLRVPLAVCAFAALAAAAYPILAGKLFWSHAMVAPPRRYATFARWAQAQPPQTRLAELPVASVLFDAYDWGFVGAGYLTNLTDRAIVSREYAFGQPATQQIEQVIAHYGTLLGAAHLASFGGLFGVTDFVVDAASDPNYYAPGSDPAPAHILGATRVAHFGSIGVYAIRSPNPLLYAPSHLFAGSLNATQLGMLCAAVACTGAALEATPAASLAPLAGRVALTNRTVPERRDLHAYAHFAPALAPGRAALSPQLVRTLGDGAVRRFCANAGIVSRALAFSGLPAGVPLVLEARYRSTGNAWLSVAAANAGAFALELPAARAGETDRIFELPQRGLPLAVIAIATPSGVPACVDALAVRIGVLGKRNLRLLGSAADLDQTTVFDAVHRAAKAGDASSSATAFWSPVAVLSGSERGVSSRAGSSGLTLATADAEASAYAFVDRVIPGGAYVVRVPLRAWSGLPPRIAVLGQNGEVLAQKTATANDLRAGGIQAAVVDPLTSGRLQTYLYVGSELPGRSAVTVGNETVRASNPDDVLVVRGDGAVPHPKAILVRQLSPDTYAIRVQDAPAQYALAFNASYNPGWRLATPAGVRATHVVANLGMNGWNVSGAGSYLLILRYDGDAYVAYGVLLGVVLLALSAAIHAAGFAQR